MKNAITLKNVTAVLFFITTALSAQEGRVGINTTAPKTTLDVSGKTDTLGNLLTSDVTGLQAPRLTRTELTAKGDALYGTDQKGALIYITDITGGDILSQRVNITTTGYYYFDGSFWQKINPSTPSDDWHTTGNAGTTAGSNFLGTTDDVDLVFKRNNVQAGWLNDAKRSTAFGVGSLPTTTIGMRNTAFGYQALGAGTGYNSVAIGEGALLNATGGWNIVVGNGLQTTSGTGNVALGWGAALNATSGINNMIVGNNSMQTLSSGNENVGVGNQSLQNIGTGSYNVAIGSQALNKVSTANNNTGIGYKSGFNVTGANNLTIGANTTDVPTNANSNQMNIGNTIFGTGMTGTSAAPAGNIGINTTTPGNTMEIKSTTAGTSGLRFTNLNSSSTLSSGQTLGVNGIGDVVTVPGTLYSSVITAGVASGTNTNWNETGLSVSLPIGIYAFEAYFTYYSGSLNDAKFRLNQSSGAMSGKGYMLAAYNGGGNTDAADPNFNSISMVTQDLFSSSNLFVAGGNGSGASNTLNATLKGYVQVTTGGTCTLQFGNNGYILGQVLTNMTGLSWMTFTKIQ